MAKLKINQIDIFDGKAIYFKVGNEDNGKVLACALLISKLIRNRKPLPQRLFDKYMSYFIPIETEVNKKYEIEYESIKNKITIYFLNYAKKYHFKYSNTKTGIHYSFDDMVNKLLDAMVGKHLLGELKEKESVIRACVQILNEYKENLNVEKRKFVKQYKIQVVAGYTTMCFGYALTDSKFPDEEKIFQATRNALKQMNPKK